MVPFDRGDLISQMHRWGRVDVVEYRENGTHVVGEAPEDLVAALRGASRG